MAISYHKKEHVEFLISKGADLTKKTKHGHTPLTKATCCVRTSKEFEKERFNDCIYILELVLTHTIVNRKQFWDKESWKDKHGAIYELRHS